MNSELEKCFYLCRGNLANLPQEFKKWKTLSYYRVEWFFLPYTLRERVVGQLLTIDYVLSLLLWSDPAQ